MTKEENKQKIKLTWNEWWILQYGEYRVKEPPRTGDLEVEIDLDMAIKAEIKAYEDLSFNHYLLSKYGYRERRLSYENHVSLRNKLNLL